MQAVIEDLFAEIRRSSMTKLGDDGKPVYRDDGKVAKAPRYTRPDLKEIIESKINTVKEEYNMSGVQHNEEASPSWLRCIADADQCDGKCPDGLHLVDDQCVRDLCDSTSSGVAWHYYQLAKGDGSGQIPFTPQPVRIDLSRSMSGPSIPASYNGTADKVGWVDQGYLHQGTTGQLQVVRLSPIIPPTAEYFLMFWTGYLVPRSTGTYTFYTWWVDDNAYLWVGDKALSPSATNFDMYIAYASVDSFGKKSHTVDAVAGRPIPFTVLNVQSGGAFSLCFSIKENDRVVMNSCGEASNWPIATNEVVSCPNAAFHPIFTGRS